MPSSSAECGEERRADSGRLASIAVMQAAKDGLTDDDARISRLDRPRFRRILAQPDVRSRFVVVGEVLPQHSAQMLLAEDDHMVKTLPAHRSDHPLDVSVLPWRLVADDLVLDAEGRIVNSSSLLAAGDLSRRFAVPLIPPRTTARSACVCSTADDLTCRRPSTCRIDPLPGQIPLQRAS